MPDKTIIDLDALKKFRQEYDKRLKNGSIVPAESLTAIDFKPVSKESGSIQETPFINQGTATNNNDSQAEVDTGKIGEHWEKQGNVVCVNQQSPILSSDNWETNNASASYNDGVATFTATAQNGDIRYTKSYFGSKKYLVIAMIKTTTATTDVVLRNFGQEIARSVATTNWQLLIGIGTSYNSGATLLIRDTRASDWDVIQVKNVQLIDLAQWFNGNIPQDLLDNPSHWSWYDNTDGSYNTGTLTPSNGRYLVCGQGRQVWDGTFEGGVINVIGDDVVDYNTFRTKEQRNVIPNRKYHIFTNPTLGVELIYVVEYDKNGSGIKRTNILSTSGTFTTSPNTMFVRFAFYKSGSSWYSNVPNKSVVQLTLSLYYATADGYAQYYTYKAPKVYDTGNEQLLFLDKKLSSGLIEHNAGEYTFTGSEIWQGKTEKVNCDRYYCALSSADLPKSPLPDLLGKCCCSKALMGNAYGVDAPYLINFDGRTVYVTVPKNANPNDIFTNGSKIQYELRENDRTTEQGTPFAETIEIDDMSNMAWYSAYTSETSNTLVTIPQGCKIFYPAWYSGFVDSLGQREDIDWSAEKIVSATQLQASETQRDTIDTQLKNALGGTLRQCLCVKESLDFDNTNVVDLSILTFSHYESGSPAWSSTSISDLKPATSGGTAAKIICTKYKTAARTAFASLSVAVGTDGTLWILDSNASSFTTSAQLQAYLKGVLLAYEKA